MKKREFIKLLKSIDACKPAVKWCKKQETIEDIFKCENGSWWVLLLIKQPQFSDKCDWSKLDGYDWACLLAYQPQFADKCDFEKLSGNDWRWILQYQPQLEKYRGGK